MIVANACTSCLRLDREAQPTETGMGVCSSFPDGIPEEIWDGSHGHLVPLGEEEVYDGDEAAHADYVEAWTAVFGEEPEGLSTEVDESVGTP